jgi:hypothetical protein
MGFAAAWLIGTTAAAVPAWSISWSPRFDAERQVLGQALRPARQTTVIARHFDAGAQVFLQHEFRDLDLPAVDGVESDTNSYVHRLTLGWKLRGDMLRLDLGATLAVSSNALKNASDLELADLQPALGVQWRTGPAWLALYADDRLGRTLVYPGFELPLHPAPAHEISVGFPTSAWRWNLAPAWQSVAAVEPDGACWRVRDRQIDRRSEVCSEAWQAAFTLRWQPSSSLGALVTLGLRSHSSLDYALSNGRAVRVDVPSGAFYAVGIRAQF